MDVTDAELLPKDRPLRILMRGPAIAGLTNPASAVVPIARNIGRLLADEPLQHLVDRARGY
jgi:glyoxylate/hydroxypyruvate reductase A